MQSVKERHFLKPHQSSLSIGSLLGFRRQIHIFAYTMEAVSRKFVLQ